jgi:exonuclease SbcC
MRPIKLTLNAFGPFADKQIVDFRQALANRLFGIYGATGAGKTSILDGLCFALFGESSGSERQGDDLRSHHATPDSETSVELIFEVGAKRFYVVRRPRQTVRGRRGDALVERPHWAALYDATDLDVDEINVENPGIVLEERKVDVVAERMRSILNYSAAQFRQVVLLPQGQFRQLLTASSDQRSAVLRGLFDVSLYERFVERLKTEAGSLHDSVEQGRAKIQGRLTAHDVEDVGALRLLVDVVVDQLTSQIEARDAANKSRDLLRIALQASQAIATRFTEQDDAVVALAALKAKGAEIEALKRRQRAANRARGCFTLDARAEEAEKELVAGVNARAAADIEVARLAHDAQAAADYLGTSLGQQAARDSSASRVTSLQTFHDRIGLAEPLRLAASASASALQIARRELDRTGPIHLSAEGALEKAIAIFSEVQQNALSVAENETKLQTLNQERGLASAFSDATVSVARLAVNHEQAQKDLTQLRQILAGAREKETAAEQALVSAQAAHLAHSLIDGEACPVCGSRDHPEPARGDPEEQEQESAGKKARQEREAADLAERVGFETAARAESEWKQAAVRLKDLERPSRDLTAIDNDLASIEAKLATLRLNCDVGTAQTKLASARTAVATALKLFTDAREAHAAADKVAASDAAAFVASLSDVPAEFHQATALAEALNAALMKRDRLVAKHNTAIAQERIASDQLKAARSTLSHAVARRADLISARDKHSAAFQAAKHIAELTDDEYLIAKADIPEIDALTVRINAHAETLAAATDRRDRAVAGVEGLTRPDLVGANDALKNADIALAAAEQAVTSTKLRSLQLEATLTAVGILEAELAQAAERYRVLGELAQLTDGRNAHRLRLRDFAIAATFDLVLEAANIRFARMSRGRFTLLRKFEGGDGRARSGLDIEVFDAHTDQKRDAHTLSGGEGFLASLSLALGLSDVVQAEAGGVKLDAIFIDEGFGHLDDETLDIALDTLRDLVGQDRAVGVISHVESVKQQISAGFDVVRTIRGSSIEARRAV